MPRPEDIYIGQRIRQRRDAQGLTQQQVANEIGTTFQQLQKYETGTNRVSGSRLIDLARAMDELAEAGYWRIGLAGEAEATLEEALPAGPVALVLGAEGEGMRHNITQHCDALARLPISSDIERIDKFIV